LRFPTDKAAEGRHARPKAATALRAGPAKNEVCRACAVPFAKKSREADFLCGMRLASAKRMPVVVQNNIRFS
jgi:hypothetical protein